MGFRTHDEEGALDTMSFDDFLVDNKEATFMLRMQGHSMERRGILDGDLIIVDRSRDAKSGDIVLAVLDDSFVVRHLSDLPRRGSKVEAVVTAVIRKYS